jgi:hypothetical protein
MGAKKKRNCSFEVFLLTNWRRSSSRFVGFKALGNVAALVGFQQKKNSLKSQQFHFNKVAVLELTAFFKIKLSDF